MTKEISIDDLALGLRAAKEYVDRCTEYFTIETYDEQSAAYTLADGKTWRDICEAVLRGARVVLVRNMESDDLADELYNDQYNLVKVIENMDEDEENPAGWTSIASLVFSNVYTVQVSDVHTAMVGKSIRLNSYGMWYSGANVNGGSSTNVTCSWYDITEKPDGLVEDPDYQHITVDADLDETSTNAVENRAVALGLQSVNEEISALKTGKMDNTTLATVAKTGSYNDLKNRPTIPTQAHDVNVQKVYRSSNDNNAYAVLVDAKTTNATTTGNATSPTTAKIVEDVYIFPRSSTLSAQNLRGRVYVPHYVRKLQVANETLNANGGEIFDRGILISPVYNNTDDFFFVPYSLLGWRLEGSGYTNCMVSRMELDLLAYPGEKNAAIYYSIKNMGSTNVSLKVYANILYVPDYYTRYTYNDATAGPFDFI